MMGRRKIVGGRHDGAMERSHLCTRPRHARRDAAENLLVACGERLGIVSVDGENADKVFAFE